MVKRKTHLNDFLRSANLEADLDNSDFLRRVLATEPMLKTLRLVESTLLGNSTDCALSIIGPYGSGKSTTAIVTLNYLRHTLPSSLSEELERHGIKYSVQVPNENIIGIVGERRSLNEALSEKIRRVFKKRSDISDIIEAELGADEQTRIVLVIDEFGKFLEYAADNPDEGDIYVLQQLAELAHRSRGRFLLITIRHQALHSYLRHLQERRLEEWKKIQGRFYEVVHASALEDTLKVLTKAVEEFEFHRLETPRPVHASLRGNPLIAANIIKTTLTRLYPIHPFSALLLIAVFRRLAQNERSLFSFLSTSEIFGLRHFVNNVKGRRSYEVADLFDYLDHNLRHTMLESDISSMWSMIDNSITVFKSSAAQWEKVGDHEEVVRAIKTIGMIDIFGPEVGLRNTKDIIRNALYGDVSRTRSSCARSTIQVLEKHSLITYRKLFETFHLWQGSDINVNSLIGREVDRISKEFDYAAVLNRYFRQSPVVARKIHIESGTFRYVTWRYSNGENAIEIKGPPGDGVIHCIVTQEVSKSRLADRIQQTRTPDNVIILLLKLSKKYQEVVKAFVAIQNLLRDYQPLVKDKIARKELEELSVRYKQRLESIFHGRHSKLPDFAYLDSNYEWEKISWDDIGRVVSQRLSKHYHHTPRIHNELINTDTPSPAAMVGFKRLLAAMLENPDKDLLGIEGSGPEYSIYLNVLKKTGIHREHDGQFGLHAPNQGDKALGEAWSQLSRRIKNTSSTKVPVELFELENLLEAAPFGLKIGLAKLLVFANVFSHMRNVSSYEEGTFIPKVYLDTLERMIKLPRKFTIQYVETSGVHRYLFRKLFEIVKSEQKELVTLLDVVTPLVQFANRLPNYTKHTSRIKNQSKAVLRVLLTTTQPEELIYSELPTALGLPQVTKETAQGVIDEYGAKLEQCYQELRTARDELFRECFFHLRKTWAIKQDQIRSVRATLRKRFTPTIVSFITDEKLKAFSNRVLEKKISDDQWISSITALLTNKSLDNWNDRDIEVYISELKLRLLQLEELERFAKLHTILEQQRSAKTEELERRIKKFLSKQEGTDGEKLRALINVYDRLMKEKNVEA